MDGQSDVFVKHCQSEYAAKSEIEGLEALSDSIKSLSISQLNIPKVINFQNCSIKMEKVATQRPNALQWRKLAVGLASLHNQPQSIYGWKSNNCIGLSPQLNNYSEDWGEFYLKYRLEAQISMIKNKAVKETFFNVLEVTSNSLGLFLNATTEFPSLIHGDLWSGNVLFSKDSKLFLIDPAVYYADKEADIAMTELFGGFNSLFYEVYNEHSKLCDEYPIKRTIYNLYHNLNHYNLFGDAYLEACRSGFSIISSEFG